MIPCFLLVPTGKTKRWLRRYVNSSEPCVAGSDGYHTALAELDVVEGAQANTNNPDGFLRTDPRWPTKCQSCGMKFREDDEWQLFASSLYRREDTGEEMPLREAPAGAMWFAPWLEEWHKGVDGRCLIVRTPGGDWAVDSRASNCTKPGDPVHKCWCRHGEAPKITVDKVGNTCDAGAGSIYCGSWHGFLRDGMLVVA